MFRNVANPVQRPSGSNKIPDTPPRTNTPKNDNTEALATQSAASARRSKHKKRGSHKLQRRVTSDNMISASPCFIYQAMPVRT